jgi:hypothetical protein
MQKWIINPIFAETIFRQAFKSNQENRPNALNIYKGLIE